MSDINQAQASEGALDLVADEGFDANWNNFLESSLGMDPDGEETAPLADTQVEVSGEDTLSGGSGNDSVPSPESTSAPGNADTPAPAGGADAMPPNPQLEADLAEVLGLAGGGEATTVAPAPDPAAPAAAAGEDFLPFQPTFRIPQAIMEGIFEADDPATREKALVTLLSSFANTITTVMEKRILEHHAPALQSAAVARVASEQTRQAVNGYFYGEFPELAPYKDAANKALAVIAKRDPNRPTSPELLIEAGELARQAIIRSGIQLPARKGQQQQQATGAPAPAPAAPPKAKGAVFEAGGARPGGLMEQSPMGPESLVEELSQW